MTHLNRVDPAHWEDWQWGGRGRNGGTAPTFASIGSTGIYADHFSSGDEKHFPELQVPHDYVEGTDLITHLHWMPSTTATYTGTWTLDVVYWLSVATGTPMSAVATSTIDFNGAMNARDMQSADFSTVLTGLDRKISSIVFARLSLSLSSGASCILGGIDAHRQSDKPGSRNINTK